MNRIKENSLLDQDTEEPYSLFAGAAKKLGIPLGEKRLDPEDLGRIEGLMQVQRDNDLKRRIKAREETIWANTPRQHIGGISATYS
jgi:hypothetical protein